MTGASADSCTRPFQLTPDPRYFYCGPTHRRVLSALLSAIDVRATPIVLIGQSGTGKTALIQKALLKVPPDTWAVFLRYTTLNADELIDTLAGELGLGTEQNTFGDAVAVMRAELQALGQRGRTPLVIVDEAQNLCEVGLRTLCRLAWDELIGLVLVGQVQVRDRTAALQAREQRGGHGIVLELDRLSEMEARDLVRHRLHVAGEDPDSVFPPEAYPLIFEHTAGNPGRINTLCERALKFRDPAAGAGDCFEALRAEVASLKKELVPELAPEQTAELMPDRLDSSVTDEHLDDAAEADSQRPANEAPSALVAASGLFGPTKRYDTALALGAMLVLIALTSWLIEAQFADEGALPAAGDDLRSLKTQLAMVNDMLAETSAKQDALLQEVAALRLENRELKQQVDSSALIARPLGAWRAPEIGNFAAMETHSTVEFKLPPIAYRVRAGDTLFGIARRNRLAVRDVARWNGLDADARLFVGDRLVLSPREELNYTVRWGDTLTGLKQRFDVSFSELRRWNNLPPDGRLYAGQHLRVYVSLPHEF